VQYPGVRDLRSGEVVITEPAADPLSGDPRPVRITAGKPLDRGGLGR